MSLSSQRSAIKAKLEAISGVGSVLDYVVWTDEWQFIYDHFLDAAGDKVNVWFVGLATSSAGSFQNGLRARTYTWNIIGYYSLKTSLESSKTFEEIIDSILAAFDAKGSIGNGLTHQTPSLAGIQNVVFAEQGAHTAQIQLTIEDKTAIASPCT